MTTTASAPPVVRDRGATAGRVLSGLVALFLLVDAVGKIARIDPVLESFAELGWPDDVTRPIGVLLLACTLVHLVPRTRVLGALLLTAYLGGAVATHVRAEQPLSSVVFPVALGAAVWGALALRDRRVLHLLLGDR